MQRITIIAFGLVILSGKFDWGPDSFRFSLRSYVLSAYLSLWFLAVLYNLKDLTQRKWALLLWGGAFLIYTLPSHWLGLKPFFYEMKLVNANTMPLPDAPDWFFKSYSFPTIPYEIPTFLLILVLGIFLTRIFRKKSRLQTKWALVFLCLITLQCWLHLSLRSPYTYVPHYEHPEQTKYWYHYYLAGPSQGAVNLDYHAFRPAEEVFISHNTQLSFLASRSFPQFLAAGFTAFFNSYYVFIVMNCLVWLVACYAFYYFANRLFAERVALFSTALFASSQGLILYVAQPKMYVFGITGTIFMLASLVYCFKDQKSPRWFLYGSILGLLLLCYEAQPWLIGLFLFAWLEKYDLKKVMMSLLLGFGVHQGFVWLCKLLPEIEIVRALYDGQGHPVDSIKQQILTFDWRSLLGGVERSVKGYFDSLKHAFQLAFIPAAFSLLFLREKNKKLLLVIFVPSLLTYSLFEMGKSFYVQFPRLVYSAYPAVYILGGMCLHRIVSTFETKNRYRIGLSLALLVLFIHFAWVNLDVFGNPRIYYEWFYRNPGHTPPLF